MSGENPAAIKFLTAWEGSGRSPAELWQVRQAAEAASLWHGSGVALHKLHHCEQRWFCRLHPSNRSAVVQHILPLHDVSVPYLHTLPASMPNIANFLVSTRLHCMLEPFVHSRHLV